MKQKYKEKLIETFVAFDNFCKQHNLKYIAAYGTLLGAVRHQGLIPWDDDIDVYMPRDDYQKFCNLKNNISGQYDIMDINNDNYWLLGLAKFVNTSTTLWEFEHLPLITGVYIDIFPLDTCNTKDFIKLKKKYDYFSNKVIISLSRYKFKQLLSSIYHTNFNLLKLVILSFLLRKRYHYYKKQVLDCLDEIISSRGEFLTSYEGPYGMGEVLNKEIFQEIIYLPFEGLSIPVPAQYHMYLKSIYGDYMKLPPIEKRISHHSHFYLNLDNRRTLSEIKIEIKK